MGSEWQEVALTDIYVISSGLSKPAKDFGSGYPFLAFKDVFYNTFVPNELTQLVQSNEKEQAACSIRRGDVFLTRTSETMNELGMSAVALKAYSQATFNGFSKRLRPKPNNNLYPEYVAYYLRSPKFRTEMMAFSTMSTRASLNNEMISRLKISVPPVAVQKSIAWILKTLDDKIDLNRQINTTLEAMAQALFKSWFVDFDPVIDNVLAAGNPIPDELTARAERRAQAALQPPSEQAHTLPAHTRQQFPDRFVFTETMGWVPEGWEVKDIGAVLELAYGKSLAANKRIAGDVPVYGSGGVTGFHNEKLVDGPGIVVGRKGTVGSLYWIESAFYPIDTVFYVVVKAEIPLYWLYQALQLIDIKSMGADSAVPGVNRNVIYAKQVSIPSAALFRHYLDQISPINAKRQALSAQITTLSDLRDTLLPKLLSGQLRIPEAEQLLTEVI